MKGLRQMCTSAIFNTQRTPFPTNSPCTACKPRASTCTSFLSCYQHHQPLPNSRTRCQPCHLCPWHHSAPALSPASGSSVAVTFPLHFRTTSSGRSSSAQHSHHTPGWQQPPPPRCAGSTPPAMPSKAGTGCSANDAQGGQDPHPSHFSKYHKYQFLRNFHPAPMQETQPQSAYAAAACSFLPDYTTFYDLLKL